MTKKKEQELGVEESLVQRVGSTSGSLVNKVKMHDWLINVVVVVVVVSFLGMIFTLGATVNDSLAEKKAINLDMRDEIKAQNDKIDRLINELEKANKEDVAQETL